MENQTDVLDSSRSDVNSAIEEQKIITLAKFIVLNIMSFGLYHLWWNYKAWRFFQQKENLDIMPVWRAIFSVFFLTNLFNRILFFAKEKGYDNNYSSFGLFLGFFITSLFSNSDNGIWLISLFSVVFFIPPFEAFNYARQNSNDLNVTEQKNYSGRQVIIIVLGLVLWGLVLIALTSDNAEY